VVYTFSIFGLSDVIFVAVYINGLFTASENISNEMLDTCVFAHQASMIVAKRAAQKIHFFICLHYNIKNSQ
jgi:hypothetical protein